VAAEFFGSPAAVKNERTLVGSSQKFIMFHFTLLWAVSVRDNPVPVMSIIRTLFAMSTIKLKYFLITDIIVAIHELSGDT